MSAFPQNLWWQAHPVWYGMLAILLIIPSPIVLSTWTGYFVARGMHWMGRKEIANGPVTGTVILGCSFYLPLWAFVYIGSGGLLFLDKLSPKASRMLLSTGNWILHDFPILIALMLAALVAAVIVAIGLRRITGRWDAQVFWCLLATGVATVPLGYCLGSVATRLSPDIMDKLPYFFPVGNSLFAMCCGLWIARAASSTSTLVSELRR